MVFLHCYDKGNYVGHKLLYNIKFSFGNNVCLQLLYYVENILILVLTTQGECTRQDRPIASKTVCKQSRAQTGSTLTKNRVIRRTIF